MNAVHKSSSDYFQLTVISACSVEMLFVVGLFFYRVFKKRYLHLRTPLLRMRSWQGYLIVGGQTKIGGEHSQQYD